MSLLHIYRRGFKVKRWHTETVLREDTVGHHSANVAAIILHLYHPATPPATLLVAALTHDLPEHTFGDVPATAKWANPELKSMLTYLENQWYERHQVANPDWILSEDEMRMLKFADLCELFIKTREERDLGNKEFGAIHRKVGPILRELLRSQPFDSQHMDRAKELIDHYEKELLDV
jgi:5'-deoxynucleotidase YfbR-like HD superfamily hydrolase